MKRKTLLVGTMEPPMRCLTVLLAGVLLLFTGVGDRIDASRERIVRTFLEIAASAVLPAR